MSDLQVLEDPTLEWPGTATKPAPRRRSAAYWTRWLHVYTSMFSLLLMLFFGATGITLNHPSWSFGTSGSSETVTGTLPDGFVVDGNIDFLAVTEFVRSENGASGTVVDYRADETSGTVSFKGPAYAADLSFDVATGEYEVVSERQGLVAIMNDLHKGRDTNSSWSWAIDVAGGLLVLISATGLGVQLFMRKRRTRAIVVASGATIGAVLLMILTLA